MIKLCGNTLVIPLLIIFETALDTGIYPKSWKCGNIVSVRKKEEKNLVKNCRPICLLPIFGKVFENILYNNLLNCKKSTRLSPGDSCISQLLSITDDIYKAFDANPSLEARGVFLDMIKAFDKVWHEGLLHKLKCYGVDGKIYELIKEFHTDRKQRVVLNGQTSSWQNVNSGVPQGSVLGLLLFVNDLPDGLQSNVKLFADDTCRFSIVSTSEAMNADLNRIKEWASGKCLSIRILTNKLQR